MKSQPWTKSELDTLRKYYPTEGKHVVNRIPRHSEMAIGRKANYLGIAFSGTSESRSNWTSEEENILKQYFGRLGPSGIMSQGLLPGRSFNSIWNKCKTLNLSFNGPKQTGDRMADESGHLKKKILTYLKGKNQKTLLDVCEYLDKSPKLVSQLLKELQDEHYNVALTDQTVIFHDQAPSGHRMHINVEDYFGSTREVVFGVAGDLHYCNIHSREELIQLTYDTFKKEGVPMTFLPGNMIDGEIFFNTRELLAGGIEGQVDYLVNHAPKVKGITTYFVTGEDHEGWLAKKAGLDIGKIIEDRMKQAGRDDWVYLSNLEADIAFKTKKGETAVRISHPGGGTAYAVSYTPQKIIESLQGGEKPHVFLCGHYHKLGYWLIRNVHTLLTGTHEDQTPFMRKKHIEAHLGFWIVNMKLKEDGTIVEFTPRCFPYLDRKVYQVNKDYPVQAKGLVEQLSSSPLKVF